MFIATILMCIINTDALSTRTCVPVSSTVVYATVEECQQGIVGFISSPQYTQMSQRFEPRDINCFEFDVTVGPSI